MSYRKFAAIACLTALAIVWVAAGDSLPVHPVCLFRALTGIPCPGCGGTRVARLLLKGEFLQSVLLNPLAVFVCLCIPLLLILLFVDCVRKTDRVKRLLCRTWKPLPTVIVLVLILANWIWNILKGI